MAERGGHKASVRKIEVAEKQRQAIELRKAGATYDEIAVQLGYAGRQGAYKAVISALAAITREPALEFKALELERLDKLWSTYWPQALAGDTKAADKCLDISKHRCKIEGAYAPTTTVLTGPNGAALSMEIIGIEVVQPGVSGDDSNNRPAEEKPVGSDDERQTAIEFPFGPVEGVAE